VGVRICELLVTTILRRVLLPSSAFSFLRRFAIALLAVVVLSWAGLVFGKSYGQREFAKSATIRIPDGVLADNKPGEPANYLLLGLDTRSPNETPAEAAKFGSSAAVGGSRSDVMMVLHVEPGSHTGMLVSFPRDLVVDIPGHPGHHLLNEAYSLGRAPLVIETLQADFAPLKINHYLQVDFEGFKAIIDAIGKIHIWFPTPVHDAYTQLDIETPGCVSVNGDTALSYARSRHYNIPKDLKNPAPWQPYTASDGTVVSHGWIEDPLSDLDRIPRQQYFLRTISQAAIDKTAGDPLKIPGLLQAVFKHFAHDQNLKYRELTDLALTFRGLNPAKISMTTLPWAPAPYKGFGGHVVAKFPDAGGVIQQLSTFAAQPKKPVVQPLRADLVKIRVVNGSGVKGAGSLALSAFTAAGFTSAGAAADADRSDYKTQVRYAPGKFREGYTVAVAVGTANLVQAASAKNTLGGDALVIVGTDYGSLKHRFDLIPAPRNAPAVKVTTSTAVGGPTSTTASTTTTTVPRQVDSSFVPVDPKTGGTLVGCPTK
jgi:LCP family protein required for cell wall assembly